MIDLIYSGKFGVLNAQKLLNTTSNNINNVNTEGFTRKETITYTNCIDWGVGDTYTRRIYDLYVQREMYQDMGKVGYYNAYLSGMASVDQMLSNDDMSVNNAVIGFFDSLSDAVQNPTSTAAREETLAALENITERSRVLNESMKSEISNINNKIDDDLTVINDLTKAVFNMNRQIRATTDHQSEIYLEMCDERDRLIEKMSKLAGLRVVSQTDDTYAVYISNGQLLCNGDTWAELNGRDNEFDNTRRDVYLTYRYDVPNFNDKTDVKLTADNIGGEIGGYMKSTDEIRQSMRELGRLMLAFTDAVNVQNEAGYTLENEAGRELLDIPETWAKIGHKTNTNFGCVITYNYTEGEQIPAKDYKVSFTSGQMVLTEVDEHGNEKDITAGNQFAKTTDAAGNMVLTGMGMTFTFSQSEADMEADRSVFMMQPTVDAAYNVKRVITKPEDFAFASAVRVSTSSFNASTGLGHANKGNAVISLNGVTVTGTNMGVSTNPVTNQPQFNTGAPNKIVINDQGHYEIYNVADDGTATYLGFAPASTLGVNIFAQAIAADGSAFDRGTGYPGYDVSVTGTTAPADAFLIEINLGGVADNSNGIMLGKLRNAAIVSGSGSAKVTLSEGYSNIVARHGSETYSAQTDLDASQAKLDQTQTLYTSSAGVNLDEEAANLMIYQQAYQACAKIIEASQTVFNSLISAF